jgi:hypothetical protein
MQKYRNAFPGIGIGCESVVVDENRRRIPPPVTVRIDSSGMGHCIALWSVTSHSYYVRLENEADDPLFYIGHGKSVVDGKIFVEPPIKREYDRLKPASGRNSRIFQFSARAQNPNAGRIDTAELRSKMRVHEYLRNGTGVRLSLPDEPAYRGSTSARCCIE